MKERFCNLITILSVAALVWLIASTIEVDMHNLGDQQYSGWNLWSLLTEEEEEEEEKEEPEITVIRTTIPKENVPHIVETHTRNNTIEYIGEFKITGYCGCAACCGKTDGITATGTHATQGRTIAVDPSTIAYGTEVIIDDQTYIAEDCGGAIRGNRIDLYFDNHSEALAFGVEYKEIYIRR